MISVNLRFPVDGGDRVEIVQFLSAMIEPTRVEGGCIDCRLYCDVEDANTLIWMEEWESREHLERHILSPRFRKILAALEVCRNRPEVRIHTIAATDDLKLIADILDKA